jgi:hypothetical protein
MRGRPPFCYTLGFCKNSHLLKPAPRRAHQDRAHSAANASAEANAMAGNLSRIAKKTGTRPIVVGFVKQRPATGLEKIYDDLESGGSCQ